MIFVNARMTSHPVMGLSLVLGGALATSVLLASPSTVRAATPSNPAVPQSPAGAVASSSSVQGGASEASARSSGAMRYIRENFSANYNSFFNGPGLTGSLPLSHTPGMTGNREDPGGVYFFNLVSVRWKFSERLGFDVQFRNQLNPTNGWQFRHQGQRFGISGLLLKGNNWRLTGAVNSDLPIPGIVGQIPQERTLLLNPGMFANFSWTPSGSRWSVFALVTPRYWFYRDANAVARQDVAEGGANATAMKPLLRLDLNPSLNYAVSDKTGIRAGTTLSYADNVGWAKARRNFMPMELGVTYDFSPALNIYTYVQSSTPLDDSLRAQIANGRPTRPWYDTASFNVWLSGKLF
jgi:hypothetical protein